MRALFDWIQIQLFINEPLDTIIHNVLGIPSDYFFLKQGKLEHYDYDHVVEYGAIRIYFDSSEQKLDCMLVMSGEALEFYRTEVLGKMKLTVKDFLLNLFQVYENQFRITRVDPAIDDWNTIPYFTPQQLMKICRKKRFIYGKSTYFDVYGLETKEKGMTVYLKPPSADDRLKFYNKQAEQAKKQGVRKKDIPPWIRTEIVLRREKAHEFVRHYLALDIELIDLVKGYLKAKVKFYTDDEFKTPLRAWVKFLGKSRPFSISIPKTKSGLVKKFDWYFHHGAIAVYYAYLFCIENNLLSHDERMGYEEKEVLFPPDLASELQKRATKYGRTELLELIVEMTKKATSRTGD
nr:replication initiation factor domain-containing protein [Enterococcus faecalis]